MKMLPKSLASFLRPFIERFPRIAAIYRCTRDQLDIGEDAISTPWNFRLAGNHAMAKGEFEPAETRVVIDLLKNVDVLVNVGANIGYYCCHALSMGKEVIAFEPMQRNLHYLCKNIKENGWEGAEVFPVALSDSVGVLEIYGGNTGASIVKGWAGIPESYVTLVPSSTMDVVLGTRLRGKKVLVLVDVEGAEKSMLDGASKMLANIPKPIWMVEITTTVHQPQGIEMNPHFSSTFQLFFENGYQAFSADEDIRLITKDKVDLASTGDLDLDTHNFLFRETKKG